jgi:hypothetical protein
MAALPLAPAPVADPADAVIVAAGLTRRFGRAPLPSLRWMASTWL